MTKKGEDQKSEFYLPAGGPDSGQVIKSALADPFQVIRLDKKSGKLCGVTVFNLEVCTSKTYYEKKKYPIASSDSFQQTLIYSGKVGDKINAGYREFSNDFARPAFNNDVERQIRGQIFHLDTIVNNKDLTPRYDRNLRSKILKL